MRLSVGGMCEASGRCNAWSVTAGRSLFNCKCTLHRLLSGLSSIRYWYECLDCEFEFCMGGTANNAVGHKSTCQNRGCTCVRCNKRATADSTGHNVCNVGIHYTAANAHEANESKFELGRDRWTMLLLWSTKKINHAPSQQ